MTRKRRVISPSKDKCTYVMQGRRRQLSKPHYSRLRIKDRMIIVARTRCLIPTRPHDWMRWVGLVKVFSYHMPLRLTPTPCLLVVMLIIRRCQTQYMRATIPLPWSHPHTERWRRCRLVHTPEGKEEMVSEDEVTMLRHTNGYQHVMDITPAPDCLGDIHNSNNSSNNYNNVRICIKTHPNPHYCLSYPMPCTPLMWVAEAMRRQAKGEVTPGRVIWRATTSKTSCRTCSMWM